MGDVVFGGDGDGSTGGEFGSDVAEQAGECDWSLNCVFHYDLFPLKDDNGSVFVWCDLGICVGLAYIGLERTRVG